MSLADAAWLGVERPENRMVVTAVLQLSGALDLGSLRALVAERIVARHPRLTQRIVRSRLPLVPPRWQRDDTFDLTAHVVDAGPTLLPDVQALQRLAGELVSQPLAAGRPPWAIHLVHCADGHSALVALFHHCLGDGMALATVLLSLADGAPPGALERPVSPSALRRVVTAVRVAVSVVTTPVQRWRSLGEPATVLRRPLQTAKALAWTRPHDLDDVKDAARMHGVSVNDVLLAATAGGLRTHLLGLGGPAADVRVLVPVDLRGGAPVPADLGNRFGIVFVTLPVGEPDPVRRLRSVAASTRRLRTSAEAGATYTLLRLVGAMPAPLRRRAVAVLDESASGVVTNVPGPREPLSLAGCRVDDIVFWVPQVGRISLGVSLFSYAGTVTVGVAVDAGIGVDAAALAEAIEDEIRVLRDQP
jgi:WS/DGAT/MGAT family acyltransferase